MDVSVEHKIGVSDLFGANQNRHSPPTLTRQVGVNVDDVATTLSTAQELAKELKKAGADKISVYTLCRE